MFSKTEAAILAELVGQASDEMSNNSCNDCPVTITEDNRADLRQMLQELHPTEPYFVEQFDKLRNGSKVVFTDWLVLSNLQRKLRKLA